MCALCSMESAEKCIKVYKMYKALEIDIKLRQEWVAKINSWEQTIER